MLLTIQNIVLKQTFQNMLNKTQFTNNTTLQKDNYFGLFNSPLNSSLILCFPSDSYEIGRSDVG